MPSFDVGIVGGGPVGLAAAIAARSQGLSVLLCERRTPPLDKACGEGLMPAGVAALERLGVALPERARPFRGISYRSGDVTAEADFPDGARGLGVRRTALHGALADRARTLGVELRFGCAAEAVPGGALRTAEGEHACRFLVGADGLRSAVRRAAPFHFPSPAPRADDRFGVVRHYALAPWSERVEVWFGNGAEAYVTPLAADEIGVAILWSPEPAANAPPRCGRCRVRRPAFGRAAAGAPGAAATGRRAGPRSRRRPVPAARGRAASGRVALVGDAAGYVDALTGEGLSLGFECAEQLARGPAARRPRRVLACRAASRPSPRPADAPRSSPPAARASGTGWSCGSAPARRSSPPCSGSSARAAPGRASVSATPSPSFTFSGACRWRWDEAMIRLVAAALAHRRTVVALFVLLAAVCLPAALRLEVDNSAEQFYPRDDPAFAAFAELESTFGSTRTVRAVLDGDDLWSRAALDRLAALERALAALPDVAAVDGPVGHHRRELDPASDDFRAAAALVEGNALDRAAGLVSADGTALSVVVTLTPEAAVDAARERQAVGAVARRPRGRPAARQLPPRRPAGPRRGARPLDERDPAPLPAAAGRRRPAPSPRHLPRPCGRGGAVPSRAARRAAALRRHERGRRRDQPRRGDPAAGAVRRDDRDRAAPLIRCRNLETVERSATEATVETYREKGRAIFWTTLSTAAGFCALATSRIEPIRDLGTWGATGMLFATAPPPSRSSPVSSRSPPRDERAAGAGARTGARTLRRPPRRLRRAAAPGAPRDLRSSPSPRSRGSRGSGSRQRPLLLRTR
ncbi:MAG: FAD-dependent monooxygenase [Thermoanaerobaculia bacterium]